jgi:hypothetical protein
MDEKKGKKIRDKGIISDYMDHEFTVISSKINQGPKLMCC